jgi:SAM-dependent methyltransferase
MDRWAFFDITHRDHVFCNPLSAEKFDELIELLEPSEGARVLDLACGKAELLARMADRYTIDATGVDLSPYFVAQARARIAGRASPSTITLIEQDGAAFDADSEHFDIAMCIGASWIHGGYRGTLRALSRLVRAGGQVVVGEPYWRRPPEAAYLAAIEERAETFSSHAGNVGIGVEEGLTPLYTLVSSEHDWDRYEGLQWRAAERHAAAHPGDPDVPTLLDRVRRERDAYLQWGRGTLGWSIYMFRKPDSGIG